MDLRDILNPLLNLSIDSRSKTIPYPAEIHDHGSVNYGFVQLKGRTRDCWRIVETEDEHRLLECLKRLNDSDTAFFTVGCEKDYNERDGTARPIGYVEICFNSISKASSATSYFEIVLSLHHAMCSGKYDLPVGYFLNLSDAVIGDQKLKGFSCAVFIKTLDRLDTDTAIKAWRASVDFLTDSLARWPVGDPPYFFDPQASG